MQGRSLLCGILRTILENEVIKAIRTFLDYKKVLYFRVNNIPIPLKGGGFRRFTGKKGAPDLVCVVEPGLFVGIEVKRPGGKLSPDQIQFQKEVQAKGGIYICVSSVSELLQKLNQEGFTW